MCGHCGERMVTVWVLDDKGNKEPVPFSVDGYEPETNTVYQFHVSIDIFIKAHTNKHCCS